MRPIDRLEPRAEKGEGGAEQHKAMELYEGWGGLGRYIPVK